MSDKKNKNIFSSFKNSISENEFLSDFKKFMFSSNPDDIDYKYLDQQNLKDSVKPGVKAGMFVILTGFLIFIVWGGLAPLDSAAIAEGSIVLSGKHKTIQHLEGGVIVSINITDGQEVLKGDVLLSLNNTSAKARLQVITSQIAYSKSVEARLHAEQEQLDTISFATLSDDFQDYGADKIIASQNNLFNIRKSVLNGQINVLNERILQYEEQIIGLKARKTSNKSQVALLSEELESVETLYKKGLALKPRVLELKRQLDSAIGSFEEIKSSVAAARETIAEANLQILNVRNEFLKEVASEYKENLTASIELNEQLNAAKDILDRTAIRAPDDGIVTDLQFFTIGGVIPPGAKIMDIIPQDDTLIVEAKVKTQDIDSIYIGLTAKVQLGAYKSRLLPRLEGKVIYISADTVIDPQNGMPHYIARIEMNPAEIDSLSLDVKLYPGMPATIFLVKGTRTFLQYLISPIRDSFFRAFKEV